MRQPTDRQPARTRVRKSLRSWGAIAWAMAMLAGVVRADETRMAGMVLDLHGDISPPVQKLEEVPADRALTLGPSTSVTFLHYGSCKLVTVTGPGTLELSMGNRWENRDLKVDKEESGPCPRRYELEGSSAGMIMRNIGAVLSLSSQPEIWLAGPHAREIATGEIVNAADPTAPIRVASTDGRLLTPAGTPPLKDKETYYLRLADRSGSRRYELTFLVNENLVAGEPLLLILPQR